MYVSQKSLNHGSIIMYVTWTLILEKETLFALPSEALDVLSRCSRPSAGESWKQSSGMADLLSAGSL